MRITAVRALDISNTNYRIMFPVMELAQRGHHVTLNDEGTPRYALADLLRSDVILVHRFADPTMLATLRHASSKGVAVVWDDDDDLSVVPRSSPLYRTMGGVHGARMMLVLKTVMRTAHAITTPSATIADKFRALGGENVHVLENYVGSPAMKRQRITGQLTLGWIAGLEHQHDFQELRLRPTFERLLDRHPELRILAVGVGVGLRSNRYEHVRRVEFNDLPAVMARFDIGIAPLVDMPFNRARSNIKVKEYASAGVPWLASESVAYAGLGEREGGHLVADSDWLRALEALIADRRRRDKLAKRGTKWGESQRIGRHAHRWEELFTATVERVRASRSDAQPGSLRRESPVSL